MLPPSTDPSGRGRACAGAGSTEKRKRALLASSSPPCRNRNKGRPAALALNASRRLSVRPKRAGLPRTSKMTTAKAALPSAASATQSASSSLRGDACRKA